MVRDKHHGPILELNRMLLKKASSASLTPGPGMIGSSAFSFNAPDVDLDLMASKTVFAQAANEVINYSQESSLFLPHRAWKVKFIGELCLDLAHGIYQIISISLLVLYTIFTACIRRV
ncbi:MAG: hypothetical protein AAF901_14405, partial [Bacteroidota bacterium]